jgi:putative DNA primase/helicase
VEREILNAIQFELGDAPNQIIFDGEFKRFPIKTSPSKKNGFYIATQFSHNKKEYYMCTFGDWREFIANEKGTKTTWKSWEESDEKAEKLNAKAKKIAEKLQAQKEQEYLEKAKKAESIFEKLSTQGTTDYLKKKNLPELFGARIKNDNILTVPIQNSLDKITSLLFIKPDGTKRFLAGAKLSSGFFKIGPEIEERSRIYICEGYATGCSVHMATKDTVIVAFSSTNLPLVASTMRQKYPLAQIVICADNDGEKIINNKMINPGLLAAQKAAQISNATIIMPPDSPMDFNDMHSAFGLDSIKELVANTEIKKTPTIRPLGVYYNSDGTVYYCLFSSRSNTIFYFKSSDFTLSSLISLNPDLNYWKMLYPKESGKGIDVNEASADLMHKCYIEPEFSREKIRRSGVWRDSGKIVINTGSNLLVNNTPIDYADFKSKYVYCASNTKLPQPIAPLSKDQVDEFFNLISTLSWKDKVQGPVYLLGWLFIAPLSGLLRWRPHIWIAGPAGSGKSWVHSEVVSKLMYYGQISEGTSTEASIRQNLNSASVPLIFDEADGDKVNSARRIDNTIELLRSASSSSTTIKKGAPNGKVSEYLVRFSAALFSIKVGLEHAQDISRFTCIEMIPGEANDFLKSASKIDSMLTKEFCDAFFYRSVSMIDGFLKNFDVFSEVIKGLSDARFADQHGTLLAGYYTALNDDIVSPEMAQFIVTNLVNAETRISESKENDEHDCLTHLLSSRVKDQHNQNHVIENLIYYVSIGMKSHIPDNGHDNRVEILGSNGISVSKCGEFVSFVKKNEAIKRLFNGTSWSNRRWEGSLLRVFGAKNTVSKVLKTPKRVIQIPISALNFSEND